MLFSIEIEDVKISRTDYFSIMKQVLIWLRALRVRTLPLSISGILVGTALARLEGYSNSRIFVWCVVTTLLYQILSNLANDLGDFLKGTDNEQRVGPMRSTQSGAISANQMKKAIVLVSAFALVSTGALVNEASIYFSSEKALGFLVLGLLAILAAMGYTLGKKAYGYYGLGDVMVFLFFGLIAVLGSYNLYVPEWQFNYLLEASAIGFLCTAVLNLNNMRDYQNDAKQGKRTLVVQIGIEKSKRYHSILVITGVLAVCFSFTQPLWLLALLAVGSIPILLHLRKVWLFQSPAELDPLLKIVALSTFVLSLFIYFFAK